MKKSKQVGFYEIVQDDEPCKTCGAGGTWMVVDDEGIGQGVSYFDIEEAESSAESLNAAFVKGRLFEREEA